MPRNYIVDGMLDAQMPAAEMRLRMGELDGEQILAVRAAIAWANRVAIEHFAKCEPETASVKAD